jgi:hypothetical protein
MLTKHTHERERGGLIFFVFFFYSSSSLTVLSDEVVELVHGLVVVDESHIQITDDSTC